jgi:hypothetical protein
MKVFAASQARQQFSSVLDCAQREGGVQIKRRDGGVFLLQPVYADADASPLSVKGVDLNLTQAELLSFIQEGRRV